MFLWKSNYVSFFEFLSACIFLYEVTWIWWFLFISETVLVTVYYPLVFILLKTNPSLFIVFKTKLWNVNFSFRAAGFFVQPNDAWPFPLSSFHLYLPCCSCLWLTCSEVIYREWKASYAQVHTSAPSRVVHHINSGHDPLGLTIRNVWTFYTQRIS